MQSLSYIDLKDVLRQEGCPICRLMDRSVKRYLKNFLYENTLDGGIREQIRRAGGFCHQHAWLLQEIEEENWKDGLGNATVYVDLVTNYLLALETYLDMGEEKKDGSIFPWVNKGPSASWLLRSSLEPDGECIACSFSSSFTKLYLEEFLAGLEQEEFVSLVKNSDGLCRPHLLGVLGLEGREDKKRLLVGLVAEKVRELIKDLQEYIRKHDYRFADEAKGEEETAWVRAVACLVGEKGN